VDFRFVAIAQADDLTIVDPMPFASHASVYEVARVHGLPDVTGRWSSPLMFARALERPEFTAAAAAMPFPSHPALYTPASS
jgi:hypothetical protein